MVVSSFETRSTQSNGSPIGSESRISPARSRISGARLASAEGASAGLTVLRCTSCLGGSIEMKFEAERRPSLYCCASFDGRAMPLAEEKTWWLESTAMMSLYLVIDQKAP